MPAPILYAGDTALDRQGSYLAGILTHYQLDYDYLPSGAPFPADWPHRACRLVILSDYPAANFTADQLLALAERVRAGLSLLMIGGWESFVGQGGNYHHSPLERVLPVDMADTDDRVNFHSPCLVLRSQDHPIIESLPFDPSPPAIGGLNRLTPKSGASVLLEAAEFSAARTSNTVNFIPGRQFPLLILGRAGRAKTAALATDVAPHWVGPFVDWGDARLEAHAPCAEPIEVGNWYARFFANLVQWLLN